MDQMKVVFIGGKQIGVNCLRELLKHGVTPALLVPNPDDTGITTWHESLYAEAKKAKLFIAEGKLKDPKIISTIKQINPGIIFCIGAMQIVPAELLAIPKLGTLNIHPALLPKYRGRFSTAHAIFNGETTHGVTLHWMDSGIDTGPIIAQGQFIISESDTGRTVYDKFTELGTKLFSEFLDHWLSGKEIVAKPQDESKATYYPKGLPGNGEIDWNWSGKQIKDWIRAMTFEPFPPPAFSLGDKKMIIIDEKSTNYEK